MCGTIIIEVQKDDLVGGLSKVGEIGGIKFDRSGYTNGNVIDGVGGVGWTVLNPGAYDVTITGGAGQVSYVELTSLDALSRMITWSGGAGKGEFSSHFFIALFAQGVRCVVKPREQYKDVHRVITFVEADDSVVAKFVSDTLAFVKVVEDGNVVDRLTLSFSPKVLVKKYNLCNVFCVEVDK